MDYDVPRWNALCPRVVFGVGGGMGAFIELLGRARGACCLSNHVAAGSDGAAGRSGKIFDSC